MLTSSPEYNVVLRGVFMRGSPSGYPKASKSKPFTVRFVQGRGIRTQGQETEPDEERQDYRSAVGVRR